MICLFRTDENFDSSNTIILASDVLNVLNFCPLQVIPCTKRFVHDWTVCPFAHAGEKAVRRDPRTHNYTGIACPDMKKMGNCIRGDRCPYAHNVFEYWLHPTRYRTQLCNDGPVCRRSICFFAHSLDELRVPACKPYVSPEALARASLDAIHANPHPLSAQLPLSAAGTQPNGVNHFGSLPASAHQQAALAALSGPSRGFDVSRGGAPQQQGKPQQYPHQFHSGHGNPSPFTSGPAPIMHNHTHTRPEPPRLSVDYGSLPRWSDCSPFVPGNPSHNMGSNGHLSNLAMSAPQQQQGGNGGRYSFGGNSDYASACSTPARMSTDNGSRRELQGQGQGQAVHPLVQVRNSGRSSSGHSSEGRASPQCNSNGSPIRQRPSAGGPSEVNDDELAHSLATLKIALTQQNAAATAASNHEVVINTLHQILREAVAQQGPGGGSGENSARENSSPSEEEASSAAAAAYAALASSMAGFTSGFPDSGAMSVSEVSADTPGRMSLEVASPTTAAAMAAAGGGSVHLPSNGANRDSGSTQSTYRLSQDLVRALN